MGLWPCGMGGQCTGHTGHRQAATMSECMHAWMHASMHVLHGTLACGAARNRGCACGEADTEI